MKYDEKTIINGIKTSMNSITPNVYNTIKNDLKKENKMNNRLKWMSVLSMACVAIIALVGFSYYNNNFKSNYTVAIDVNPSVELYVSKNDKVVKAKPLNEGGIKILDNMDLENVSLNVAVNAITGSMLKYGFLTGDDANVLVTVQNNNQTKREKVKTTVSKTITEALNGSNVSAVVLNQSVNNSLDNDIETFANNNNISYGKALFITNLVKKDATLNKEELATMSLRKISELVKANNIDIKDIVDYEKDDSILENIEETIEDTNENKNINPKLTKEEAKQIAYKHALVSAKDVDKVTVLQDEYEYEVEFKTNTKKYEYEINVMSGKVESYETETIKTQSNTINYIGEAKAKQIAFAHANVTDAKLVKVVLDTDDNIKVYDIDFVSGNHEYEYEINAVTGKIIDFDSEIKD